MAYEINNGTGPQKFPLNQWTLSTQQYSAFQFSEPQQHKYEL